MITSGMISSIDVVGKVDIRSLMMIFSAMLFVGISILIAFVLCRIMRGKSMLVHNGSVMGVMGCYALVLFARYGLTVESIQGLFLLGVLLYASCSDLTTHMVDDYVWIIVLALSLGSISSHGIGTMTLSALCVFVPQMALAFLPPKKTLGGADIKLSTALAFLLGSWRGVGAYIFGLLLAVICITIYCKVKKSNCKKPFALVPYLSIGAMLMFLI